GGIARGAAMTRSERVAQRSLALAAPHETIHRIAARIVLSERLPECLHFRIVKAERGRLFGGERNFLKALDAVEVVAKNIFIPAEGLHASGFCLRQDGGENVKIAMIRRLNFLERCVAVVLLVSPREVATVKIGVVLLLAVIGQRLAGNLAPSDTASVGE